jgi:hypothetical protein
MYTINAKGSNPSVRERVDNFNRMLCNNAGETNYTYNPDACPLLDADFRGVRWTQQGKLTGNGKVNLTHSSDGTGYMLMEVFPPLNKSFAISSKQSESRRYINSAI